MFPFSWAAPWEGLLNFMDGRQVALPAALVSALKAEVLTEAAEGDN